MKSKEFEKSHLNLQFFLSLQHEDVVKFENDENDVLVNVKTKSQ